MEQEPKSAQLQIRVSRTDKATIQRAAKRAGMDMSTYVMSRVLPAATIQFQECVAACASSEAPSFGLAELNSLLASLTPGEMRLTVEQPPAIRLPPFLANYVAAMVEYGCARCQVPPPVWTRAIAPLEEPMFGSALQSLRLYLLTHSPPPFRLRNIFIDSTLGQRV
jgi:hypothetical protein